MLSDEILDKALEWLQNHSNDIIFVRVGSNKGFDSNTIAIDIGDNVLVELSRDEIEYRAELAS